MPEPTSTAASIRLTAHPPERRRRSSVIAAQACCCCCCCCCLHTIGGLIGALVGSLVRIAPTPREIDPDAEFPFRRDEELPTFVLPASAVYWALFSLAAGLTWGGIVLTFMSPTAPPGGGPAPPPPPVGGVMIGAGVGVVMLLPVVQLGASLLAVIVVALLPRSVSPDRRAAVVRIGWITLWSFVGTAVGTLLMCLPFLPALFDR